MSAHPNSRKRSATDYLQPNESKVSTVADGYSNTVKNIATRKDSPLFRLFSLNNWIKSVLLKEFIPAKDGGATVLDFGCGKGGDFQKFDKCSVGYVVAADVAHGSVEEAVSRYNSLRNKSFGASFIIADCHEARLMDHLRKDILFDTASCQFSLHYAFMTEERARMALRNVSERLLPGGHFVGTIPDANILVRRFRESGTIPRTFGNRHVQVTLDRPDGSTVFSKSQPFGIQYTFRLTDAIDDLPEYLVPFNVLERLADEFGLELVMKANFHEYLYETLNPKRADFKERTELLERMKVVEAGRFQLSDEEWEIAHLYLAFAFRKRDPIDPAVLARGVEGITDRSPHYFPPSDIIRLR